MLCGVFFCHFVRLASVGELEPHPEHGGSKLCDKLFKRVVSGTKAVGELSVQAALVTRGVGELVEPDAPPVLRAVEVLDGRHLDAIERAAIARLVAVNARDGGGVKQRQELCGDVGGLLVLDELGFFKLDTLALARVKELEVLEQRVERIVFILAGVVFLCLDHVVIDARDALLAWLDAASKLLGLTKRQPRASGDAELPRAQREQEDVDPLVGLGRVRVVGLVQRTPWHLPGLEVLALGQHGGELLADTITDVQAALLSHRFLSLKRKWVCSCERRESLARSPRLLLTS